MAVRRLAAACLLALALPATRAGAALPPGASAVCRDGTYSFSHHRSGTCSHHGGVATWLAPAGGGGGGGSGPAPAPAPAPGRAPVALGGTVLLAPRTRTAGCRLGALPDRRCSPGAYYSRLTAAVVCAPGFRTSTIRHVPQSEKSAVELEYGMAARLYGHTLEIDHIVPLELGGSNAIANLYPEEAVLPHGAPGYHVKDVLENDLHDRVCAREMSIAAARAGIAQNWEALYRATVGAVP